MQTIDQILPNERRAIPQIYMYDDTSFPGWIKIGQTTRADVRKRIDEQHPITEPHKTYHLLWHDNAFYADGSGESFSDHDLHECLRRMGKELIGEWCRCSLREAQAAYVAVRHRDTQVKTDRDLDYKMRDEQEQAVKQTADYFAKMDIEEPNRPSHYLWNAKMRFGNVYWCSPSNPPWKIHGATTCYATVISRAGGIIAVAWTKNFLHCPHPNHWLSLDHFKTTSAETAMVTSSLKTSGSIVSIGI